MIRKATLEDIDLLMELNYENIEYHKQYSVDFNIGKSEFDIIRKEFENAITDNNRIVLLSVENLGFCLGLVNNGKGVVAELFVAENFRRKNCGKDLLLNVEAWFKQKNCGEVEVVVYAKNDSAISFYEKLGYSKLSEKNNRIKLIKKI